MSKVIRIGTRNSELALWQAYLVQGKLQDLGYQTEIVELSSIGDEILDIPLHQIGSMGVFTKTLDVAMLRGQIDIAVHSLKDVPTQLPETIVQAAVLERADVHDVVVYKGTEEDLVADGAVIATGSLRRTAQWLHKYPAHTLTDLRGNVNTRLQKLQDNNWNGAIFAKAGLERINLLPENHLVLDWMIPAPAQGAIMVTALESDNEVLEACAKIHHKETALCVGIERDFMRTLEGGCTAPIGGNAEIVADKVTFKGLLSAIDGKEQKGVFKIADLKDAKGLGEQCAQEILANGGDVLMAEIKKVIKK
ncbi:hydroxymethylbilane synthase [Wenyingzhuangia marina]|uniref:Hydroxymethylbilane synthase n=1 Tax=Wenyingzhuangia marina TaxID=1195760 RepID=A0A1M5U780_9FLAO|nr:hydroxymethylbilane synthase [Wenyingzhuangia marina]GGF69220.1 hydroxymethylbilane synthase [Wenyingzhuangia marina]SHH58809.1 hydroxymethylbilane synthase [Wenyingzhuangia marina]